MKFLVIGDIHIKEDNVQEINILLKNIEIIFAEQISFLCNIFPLNPKSPEEHVPREPSSLCRFATALAEPTYEHVEIKNEDPFDHIVLLGDILHHHEKIFTQSLNRALNFIKRCTELCHTYILVGNHDYCLGENVHVLLWHGGIKMSQDIVEGDVLIGDDGKPCDVIALTRGRSEMYKVCQSHGDDYIVSKNHKITVAYYSKLDGNNVLTTSESAYAIIDISIDNFIEYSEYITQYFYGLRAENRDCKKFRQNKIKVMPIGSGNYYGWEVNNKTKRFLLGDNTVTHNCSNSEFLTENHWLNALKKWDNLTIIDKVQDYGEYIMCPYVYPGRFIEALETECPEDQWKTKKIIFAHQEFEGCQMGAIKSVIGDKWDTEYPQVISGHIHDTQILPKVFYPGAPLQHSFGDTDKRIVISVDINLGKIIEIPLNVPKKHIIHSTIENLPEKLSQDLNKNDKKKVKLDATLGEFKMFKETREYKDMIKNGIKFQLINKQNQINDEVKSDVGIKTGSNFLSILESLIDEEKDEELKNLFNSIVTTRSTN